MLLIGADHVASAGGADAIVLLAIPVLWMVGVVLFVAFKFHRR
jgi:hypothetical protein